MIRIPMLAILQIACGCGLATRAFCP